MLFPIIAQLNFTGSDKCQEGSCLCSEKHALERNQKENRLFVSIIPWIQILECIFHDWKRSQLLKKLWTTPEIWRPLEL